jgi:hypothetical protein
MCKQHQDELAKYQEQLVKVMVDHREHKEELEKLRKENDDLKSELWSSNSTDTCSLLLENYKKIRAQSCDLTLELAGGKTLSVHKTILMGKLLNFDPLYLITDQFSFSSFSSAQFKTRRNFLDLISEHPQTAGIHSRDHGKSCLIFVFRAIGWSC